MGPLASAQLRANLLTQAVARLANAVNTAQQNTGGRENFDGQAYLRQNPDVAADPFFSRNPYAHYVLHGQNEGRNLGGGNFDGQAYLRANPDVAADPFYGRNPFQHFLDHGLEEERDLGTNPTVNASRQNGQQGNGSFDEDFYLAGNPDVAAAVARGDFASGYEHYLLHGSREGRSPNQSVNPAGAQGNNQNPSPQNNNSNSALTPDQLRANAAPEDREAIERTLERIVQR